MQQNNKTEPLKKPYRVDTNTRGAVRTVIMIFIIAAGLIALSGSLLVDFLPRNVVIAAAAVFVSLLALFLITGRYMISKEEKRYEQALLARKTRVAEIEALGFSPTFKSIGSSRYFAVDKNMGKWFLINYYNDPLQAKLYDLSSIKKYRRHAMRITSGRGIISMFSMGKN